MPVFFINSSLIQNASLNIEGPLFNHIHKSLRVHEGDIILFGDEKRQRYQAKVTEIGRTSCICTIMHTQQGPPPPPYKIIIGQAILKGTNMNWAIQKATELGVSSIIPLLTSRVVVQPQTSRFKGLQERWQRIAVEASQQSERWEIPEIYSPCRLQQFFETNNNADLRCILAEREGSDRLQSLPIGKHFTGKIIIAVGPEGGWTIEEFQEAQQHHFMAISLGPYILRGETAPLVALSILQNRLGNLS